MALVNAGVDEQHVVTDTISGSRAGCPGLDELLEQLQHGDVLTVWKLDRLGRSVSHLVGLVEELGERGIQFRSLTDGLDTTTTSGRFMFNVVAAMAQFERDLNQERTVAALAALREKGVSRPAFADYPRSVRRDPQPKPTGQERTGNRQQRWIVRSMVRRVFKGEVASMVRFTHTEHDGLLLHASGVPLTAPARGRAIAAE